jgi:predicted nicotinamide N-methyase
MLYAVSRAVELDQSVFVHFQMEDEEDFGFIGSMFDTAHARSTRRIDICGTHIDLRLIDAEPGHVISGQYLWPAAEALAKHVVPNWHKYGAPVVVELGAGCGLAGIACSIASQGTSALVLTDHDPGSLKLLEENIHLNHLNADISFACDLEWGDGLPSPLVDRISASSSHVLVIGSDLIYCSAVVRPLLSTVRRIFNASPGRGSSFILAASFDTGKVRGEKVIGLSACPDCCKQDAEVELIRCCDEFLLRMNQITALNTAQGICRILKFIPQKFPSQKRSMKSDVVASSLQNNDSQSTTTSDSARGAADEVTLGKRIRRHDSVSSSPPLQHISEGARNRYSHKEFFQSRDWDRVRSFWARLIAAQDLPPFICGDPASTKYTVCDLSKIHAAGLQEYAAVDNPR